MGWGNGPLKKRFFRENGKTLEAKSVLFVSHLYSFGLSGDVNLFATISACDDNENRPTERLEGKYIKTI